MAFEHDLDDSRRRYRDRSEAALRLAALRPAAVPVVVADSDNSLDSLRPHGGGIVGFGYAAVLWALLGYVVVRSDSPQHQLLNPPFSRTVK